LISPSAPRRGTITIADLLERKREVLELELVTGAAELQKEVRDPDITSPGLALAGYTEQFAEGRLQVFGETEMTYLTTLAEAQALEQVRGLFAFDIPAVFVTKGQTIPEYFVEAAREARIPVIRSRKTTKEFYRRIKPFLESALAPTVQVHGSLADVYGVGLLFVGDSGVGKSECVLDLVERGHRLVADDLVIVSRQGNDVLMAEGHKRQSHHMAIRGLGIVDIRALFGIRAVRQRKRIEVVVQLEYWDADKAYDRTGLDREEIEILGVTIPAVTVPLNPGKNITVISEVVAMNHLLKYSGVDSSAIFNQRLMDTMAPVREYLEQDYE